MLFEQAFAAAPLTLPAHSTIFTGLLPPKHGVRDNGGYVLDGRHTTLAGVLKDGGWQTGAFVGAFVLDSKWGLNRGFDTYVDKFDVSKYKSISLGDVARRAGEVVDNATPWLDQHASQRFFAWLHFYDAHSPYDPPEPFKSRFADRPYAGEIAYVDDQIGRVLQWLDARGLTDRTIVVAIGDHGESLNEHGEGTHGLFIYDATTRIPFIVRAPFTATRGRRVPGVVRSEDLMPTILDLVGRPSPKEAQGRSLVPLLTGADAGLESRCVQRVAVRAEPLRVERAEVDQIGPVQVHLDDAARAVRSRARSRGAEQPLCRAPSARRSDGGGARAAVHRGRAGRSLGRGPGNPRAARGARLHRIVRPCAAAGRGSPARSQGQDRHLQPDDVGARDQREGWRKRRWNAPSRV